MKADNSHSTPKSEDGKGFNPNNHPTPMEKLLKSLTGTIVNHLRVTLTVAAATAVLIAAVVIVARLTINDSHAEMEKASKVTLSPTQITSIEDIGEWEFLSIADEELVDTVSHGFFGDDRLVRIYYGTLRLGVNMHEVHSGWLTMDNDTVVATLPPIKLLDNDFIDEARTKSFYEEGDWNQADREAMYQKAYNQMYSRCMTPDNIKSAEENAKLQLSNILHSMGFEHVRVDVGIK